MSLNCVSISQHLYVCAVVQIGLLDTHTHTSVEKGREPYCTISEYLQFDIELLDILKTKNERDGFRDRSAHAFRKNESTIELLDIAKAKTGMDEFRVEVQIIPRNNPALRQLIKIEQRLSG
jgi:hypothetical protein